MPSIRELRAVARLMKKEGVLSLKAGEIEMHMSPIVLAMPRMRMGAKPEVDPDRAPYTEDETLFWSSPSNPEANN